MRFSMHTGFLQMLIGIFRISLLIALPHRKVGLCPKFKDLKEGLCAELSSVVAPPGLSRKAGCPRTWQFPIEPCD